MKAIKTVKLIFSEADENKNKVWIGTLFDNGDVETKWGRIGNSLQSKQFSSVGSHYLDKKAAEKRKKGYTELHTVDEGVAVQSDTVSKSSLHQIAKRDIVTSSPLLTDLVDRLVKSNIHTIVSSTSIEYNSSTGLFSTPLGVVTMEAIAKSRDILADIKKHYDNERELKRLTSLYLRYIPHAIGMKFNVRSIFPNGTDAIEKELDIIDSLEASYQAMQTPIAPVGDAAPESVFNVNMDIVNIGSTEYRKCHDMFTTTNKSMHGYQHYKVKNVYEIDIKSMSSGYDSGKVGNHTRVFHGTSEANLLSILKNGLKTSPPSTAYIAGKMFGNGIYGSQTASKSLGYTTGRWGGSSSSTGWLFICDFAMGKPYYPLSTLQRIPSGYHSCWALPGKVGLANDELIVYNNDQVNIRYLLEIAR